MKKNRITIVLCIMIAFLTLPVFAESEKDFNLPDEKAELNLTVKMDGSSVEAPLTLKKDKVNLFMSKNTSPGDKLNSTINFTNKEKVPVQVAVLNVDDSSSLPDSAKDEINLEVSLGGDKIYSGAYSKITDPLTNWIVIKPGESIALNVEMSIPKEADNRWQGKKLASTWHFGVRSNILNAVNVKIIYKDESGKIIKTENKEFDYDHLVTAKDLNIPKGYMIFGFEPKKVTKDGDEIEVILRIGSVKDIKLSKSKGFGTLKDNQNQSSSRQGKGANSQGLPEHVKTSDDYLIDYRDVLFFIVAGFLACALIVKNKNNNKQ